LIGGLGSYPTYFARLADLNRSGPLAPDRPHLVGLDPDRVRRLLADGATVVDVRPTVDYAAGHLPGSVSIHLRPQFATWLGWLLPPEAPLVIVRNPDQDPDDILWPALKVGYSSIVGELTGGTAAWVGAGGRLSTMGLVGAGRVEATNVVDVRQRSEHAAGHLPGAHLIELGALAERVDDVPDGPTTVMCEHGERSATAASLLERAGRTDLSIMVGGPDDWAAATGKRLERDV
jgi:rhodanese-related sulfurtransferase